MTWMFRWSAAGSLTAHRRPPYLLRRWRVNIDACPALHSCYLFRFITFLVFFCTYVNKTFVARYQHSLVFISVGNSTWANRSWWLFKMSNFERKSEFPTLVFILFIAELFTCLLLYFKGSLCGSLTELIKYLSALLSYFCVYLYLSTLLPLLF